MSQVLIHTSTKSPLAGAAWNNHMRVMRYVHVHV